MSDVDSAENKRKRQDSIQSADELLETAGAVTDDSDEIAPMSLAETAERSAAADTPAGGSSPVKRPRTSEDNGGDDDSNSNSPAPATAEAREAGEAAQANVKRISMEDAPAKPLPVFGSAFGGGKPGGFSSFANAAKNASPFAAFTGGATSGFAKYASTAAKPDEPSAQEDLAGGVLSADSSSAGGSSSAQPAASAVDSDVAEDDSDAAAETAVGQSKRPQKTFEDLLTTKGKETLNLTSPVATPLTPGFAHNAPTTPTVPVRTFEEDETCLYSTKAKLFELQNAAWKERGNGQFRLNRMNDDASKCRMVMRTDLTFRLILNVPLFHGMKAVCERRFVRFTCFDVQSKLPITYALRFTTDAMAADTYARISAHIPDHHDDDAESEGNNSKDERSENDGEEDEDDEDDEGEHSDSSEPDSAVDSESDQESAAADEDAENDDAAEEGPKDTEDAEDADEDADEEAGDAEEEGEEDDEGEDEVGAEEEEEVEEEEEEAEEEADEEEEEAEEEEESDSD